MAERGEEPTSDDSTVSFADLPCVRHILVDVLGRHHVVLRANGTVLQLLVQGADIAAAPVAITFLVRGLGAIADAAAQLATLRFSRVCSSPCVLPKRGAVVEHLPRLPRRITLDAVPKPQLLDV